jgi:hypothetical protein
MLATALFVAFLTQCQIAPQNGHPMSTQENGFPRNVVSNAPAAINIASSTNANPIVVTTSAPHNLTTGDVVSIQGHQVNTSANRMAVVTVLSATTFSISDYLLGGTVAGVGIGGATGTVQAYGTGTTFAIPADGVDNEAAASVNTPFNALADRTAFLTAATGGYSLSQTGIYQGGNPGMNLSLTNNAWTAQGTVAFYTPPVITGLYPAIDLIELDISSSEIITVGSSTGVSAIRVAPFVSFYDPGGAPTFNSPLPSGAIEIATNGFDSGGNAPLRPFTMTAQVPPASVNHSVCAITFGVYQAGTGGSATFTWGQIAVRWRVWRQTGLVRP